MWSMQALAHRAGEISKERKEPGWLLEYRLRNAEVLSRMPLKKSPYSDLEKLDSFLEAPQSSSSMGKLPEVDSSGARVFTLAEGVSKFPGLVKKAVESEAQPLEQYEAFANAFFTSGFVIAVSGSGKAASVVEWVSKVAKGQPMKAFVIVGENLRNVQMVEHVKGSGEGIFYSQGVVIGKGSSVSFVRLHESSADSTMLCYQQVFLERDAELINSNGWLDGKAVKAGINGMLIGEGSSLRQFDFMLADDSQNFDIKQVSNHIATDTNGLTVFKGVLSGKSRSTFDGMIKIPATGQRTNSLLEAHGMLLDNTATSNNIPGLEIEADDVRATHSATVAHIDEDQLFYLQARGIPDEEARHMIVSSFLESVVSDLPPESREKCVSLLEQKFGLVAKHTT